MKLWSIRKCFRSVAFAAVLTASLQGYQTFAQDLPMARSSWDGFQNGIAYNGGIARNATQLMAHLNISQTLLTLGMANEADKFLNVTQNDIVVLQRHAPVYRSESSQEFCILSYTTTGKEGSQKDSSIFEHYIPLINNEFSSDEYYKLFKDMQLGGIVVHAVEVKNIAWELDLFEVSKSIIESQRYLNSNNVQKASKELASLIKKSVLRKSQSKVKSEQLKNELIAAKGFARYGNLKLVSLLLNGIIKEVKTGEANAAPKKASEESLVGGLTKILNGLTQQEPRQVENAIAKRLAEWWGVAAGL
jgi:hypothetical protein